MPIPALFGIVMSKNEFCSIKGFEPSPRTQMHIKEMNNVVNMTKLLQDVMVFVPLFQIFAGRNSFSGVSTASAANQISTYDWELYKEAMQGLSDTQRKSLEKIAGYAILHASNNKERKFWECIYNGL